jgi:FERM domain-containing protein 5
MNNSNFSEHEGNRNKVTNVATPSNLESFDEREWDMSMTSSLPTEFDLIPDITPTDDEAHSIIYETPEVHSSPSHNPDDKGRKKANQKKTRRQQICTILRTSLLSSLLLVLLLACLIILVIEVDSDMLSSLRKLPEMVALRRDYYEPMKESFWEQFNR